MDGVLIDSEPVSKQAFAKAFAVVDIEFPENNVYNYSLFKNLTEFHQVLRSKS